MSRTFFEILSDLDNIKEELDAKIFNEVVTKPSCNWIPCSERLPGEDGNYLVTVEFDYGREVEMGWLLNGEWMNPNSHVTVAWMPLPEPVLI